MKHCPLVLRRVDRPIFHFTTVTGHKYEKTEDGQDGQAAAAGAPSAG